MVKKVFIIFCTVLGIAALPEYAQDLARFTSAEDSTPESVQAARVGKASVQPRAHYTTGVRAASVPMDSSGHFTADFRINGRNIRGLIDTGATYVALNASTARSLGLGLTDADFKHQVTTANGKTRAALVVLDRMDVGSISVDRVDAFVLDDDALNSTLIGMSFMSKLNSYQVRNNTLELAL